jgi:signal transduction histidine kinase
VALAVHLRLAQQQLARRPDRASNLLAGLDQSVQHAVSDLLEVVGGRPRLLARSGLTAALRAAADTCPVPVELLSSGLRRYPPDVEHALYYCCLEALQNVAKHAAAQSVVIELHGDERGVTACVRDDGRGFTTRGSSQGGLAHMGERISGVGGVLTIHSVPNDGTTIQVEVPIAALAGTS